jgi:hypothetical protein
VRRVTVFGATTVAMLMAVASLAWACTTPEGATFFTNGKVSQTVMRGSRISAFATNAPQSVGLKLVIGENGPHPTHACMVTDFTVNNTVRFAGSDGFIAPTAGPAGDVNLAKGTYQVCFTDYQFKNVSTSAATLTII